MYWREAGFDATTSTEGLLSYQPGTFDDHLTEVLRNGARTLFTQAVEAEVSEFLAGMPISRPPMGIGASCTTVICPSVRS